MHLHLLLKYTCFKTFLDNKDKSMFILTEFMLEGRKCFIFMCISITFTRAWYQGLHARDRCSQVDRPIDPLDATKI